MTAGWQVIWQVARRRTVLLAKSLAKYGDPANYTRLVGSTDPQSQAGPAAGPGWSDCPPGYVSLSEASRRTGFSAERLRQRAHTGDVDSVQIQVGSRTRIWLAEDQISDLAKPGNRQGFRDGAPVHRPGGTVLSRSVEERDPAAIADERDRWRSEALRMREAGLLMAAAFDAQREADQHRADAHEHMRAAAASVDKAFEKAREAADYQNQALRQFMIPTDMLEN
jgi:hypothetical protein